MCDEMRRKDIKNYGSNKIFNDFYDREIHESFDDKTRKVWEWKEEKTIQNYAHLLIRFMSGE